jgi:hypothetical protein
MASFDACQQCSKLPPIKAPANCLAPKQSWTESRSPVDSLQVWSKTPASIPALAERRAIDTAGSFNRPIA